MKKSPEAFRTISEVSEILETPAHVLRFWESKFYQIRPVKRAGGRRYYRPDDVALVNGIRILLQDQGMTIRGVQRILQEQGIKHIAALGTPLPQQEIGRDSADVLDVVAIAARAGADGVSDFDSGRDDSGSETGGSETAPEPPRPGSSPKLSPKLPTGASTRPDLGAGAPPATFAPGDRTFASDLPSSDAPVAPAERGHFAGQLRALPRGALGNRREPLVRLGRRIDVLLERMSEASGAGRW